MQGKSKKFEEIRQFLGLYLKKQEETPIQHNLMPKSKCKPNHCYQIPILEYQAVYQ